MGYHRPLLRNGKIAPIPWEIQLSFLNVSWPISENSSRSMRFYNKFIVIVGFFIYCYLNEAELHYIIKNIHDIGLALEGMATYLILMELHLRTYSKAFNKPAFKELLNDFFMDIYIEKSANKSAFKEIQRLLLPTKICSYFYITTLFSYLSIPIMGFFTHQRYVPFKATFHYEFDSLYFYIPTLMVSSWIGFAVVSHLVAESNLLAMIILHLNGRYLELQHDLDSLHKKLSQDVKISTDRVLKEYQRYLIDIIKRNIVYHEFAQKFQKQYSLCIFVMMAFSAVLLCVLAFKAATLGMTTTNITFISWIIAKIIELLVFGTLGSKLIDTTNNMSTFYYMANWEDVILNSTHTTNNIDLMKLIILAIELNQKPFSLSGYNYFAVSLATVVSILQGAGSYFTFLYAFR